MAGEKPENTSSSINSNVSEKRTHKIYQSFSTEKPKGFMTSSPPLSPTSDHPKTRQLTQTDFCITQLIIEPKVKIIQKVMNVPFLKKNNLYEDYVNYIDSVNAIQSPMIIPFQIEKDEDNLVLSRSFIQGITLTEYVTQGLQNDGNILFVMWKVIVRAFQHLHKYRIFPNYIHPNNIYMVDDARIQITDLYIPPTDKTARLRNPAPITMGFLPPELFNNGKETGVQSDVWSLGVLLHFMLTKELPWNSRNIVQMMNQIGSANLTLVQNNPDIPKEAKEIITHSLQLDPSDRITTEEILYVNPAMAKRHRSHNKKGDKDKQSKITGLLLTHSSKKPRPLPPRIKLGSQTQLQTFEKGDRPQSPITQMAQKLKFQTRYAGSSLKQIST